MYVSSQRLDTGAPGTATRLPDAGVQVVDRGVHDPAGERRALVAGLLSAAATISPKYFYDAAGCELFTAICALPEYYPTRTEARIFDRHRDEIVGAIGTGKQWVDLGAGDCAKGAAWFPFAAPRGYVAVDIARDAMCRALARLARAFPEMDLRGIVADFTGPIDLHRDLAREPTTFFYPGSSIGNFTPGDALRFLTAIRRLCAMADARDSGLLIGVDTKKDPARLRAAYDDAAGVTAAFNRNILVHVNRILATQFDPHAFAHVAFYDHARSRVEMHLEALRVQRVVIDGTPRTFAAGERIHTENSYKYAPEEFIALLERAGFGDVRCWQDAAGDFAVCYAA